MNILSKITYFALLILPSPPSNNKNIHIQPCMKDTVAVIAGPREVFLKAGSQLRLHCIVDLGERQGWSAKVRGTEGGGVDGDM